MLTPTETFYIRNIYTNAVKVAVKIECDPDTPRSIKLGLAVKAAIKERANFNSANLPEANLSRADLSMANFNEACLYKANFIKANLTNANFAWANLTGANLTGANLIGTYFAKANLAETILSDANFNGAIFVDTKFSGATIGEHILTGIIARATRLDGHEFFLFGTEGGHIIRADFQTLTIQSYRLHVAKAYPDTPKATETLAILDYFERRLDEVIR